MGETVAFFATNNRWKRHDHKIIVGVYEYGRT